MISIHIQKLLQKDKYNGIALQRRTFWQIRMIYAPDKSFYLYKIVFLNEIGLQIFELDQVKVHKKMLQHMALNTSNYVNKCTCNFINERN